VRYDPERAPDPEQWLALGELERIEMVRRFHRRAGIRLPNPEVHAIVHVTLENQVAMGDEIPVAATVARLMGEGLSRHDALHAVGSVLLQHMAALQSGEVDMEAGDPNARYYDRLKKLTRRSWYDEFGQGGARPSRHPDLR
jgi:hypothetical protein